jgi:TPP-dependent pyruvate/acetoin dehydrogenase alpha subunit
MNEKAGVQAVTSLLETYDPPLLIEMLRKMYLIRAFDSFLPDLYTQQLIRGSSHAAIGQEASAVGTCAALRTDDFITSTHRGHGHTIAKAGDLNRMMAELLGRIDGYCRGKGGSMHIADFSIGMLGANGIVGGGFGLAGGAALSARLRGTDQVVVCFFGDGAINQGAFHEIANLAAIWKLPLLFVCENNQFAMSGRASEMVSVADLAARAVAYGFPGVTIDGMDVLAVYDTVSEAVGRMRGGEGPCLIVNTTYRFAGHYSGDTMKYRTKEEAEPWLARDPIARFRQQLVDDGILTEDEAGELEEAADRAIADALEFAKRSPLPDPATAWEDLYA